MNKNSKDVFFTLNSQRINYLLEFYNIELDTLLKEIQGNNKREVISKENLKLALEGSFKIPLNILKKIDLIFEKGITWYISKFPLPNKEKKNIFFRKDKLNAELNFATKKIIEEYEEKKVLISNYCENLDFEAKREFNFSIKDSPKEVSYIIRDVFEKKKEILIKEEIIKKTAKTDREYLEQLIRVFEQFNIFIFEHVNYKRSEDKIPNFNGFFLSPNLVVIQRQQKYLKREIFTLMHEIGHYLINEEEVDEKVSERYSENLNEIEKWCNDFAYYFLAGKCDNVLKNIPECNTTNNFNLELFDKISKETKLSTFALLTRSKVYNKISESNYNQIYNEIQENIKLNIVKEKEENRRKAELAKENGEKLIIPPAKPIESKLFKDIVRMNYFEGKLSEPNVLKALNVKNKSFEEVIYS